MNPRQLLKKFSVTKPPVPVDKLVQKLGLQLCNLPSSDEEISGAIVRSDGKTVIAVNPAQHVNRRRFTIAHELGHYFLHRGIDAHIEKDFRVNWRDDDSSRGVNWEEVAANRYAAELLMPEEFLEKDIEELNGELDRSSIYSLAKRYQVSTQAMEIRLVNLGFITPHSEFETE